VTASAKGVAPLIIEVVVSGKTRNLEWESYRTASYSRIISGIS